MPEMVDKIMPKEESALADAVRVDAEAEPAPEGAEEPKAEEKKEAS
jgi:hypothetical protein